MRGVCALALLLSACGRLDFSLVSASDDARGDTAMADATLVMFTDDFERANSLSIGNAWAEKTPGTYGISGGRLVRQTFSRDYRDDIVVRPASEDELDLEVSIEFTVTHVPPGYPQVEARIQRNTLGVADTLDGYLLYIDNASGNGLSTAAITCQHGSTLPTPLMTFPLSPQLGLGQTYRLRLSVRGTTPVQLDAIVESHLGATYTTIGSASLTDSAASAVRTPGAIGFATGQPEAVGYYTYDTFSYRSL